MKNLTTIIISILFISLQALSQDSFQLDTMPEENITSDLTVEVTGIKSDKGTMMVAVYGSEGQWLSQNIYGAVSEIVNGKATVVFENIPIGTYGISTFQDKNDNSKLDTGLFGIPKEPYASSRGAKGMFGPPKWTDAKFDVKNTSHKEEIKY